MQLGGQTPRALERSSPGQPVARSPMAHHHTRRPGPSHCRARSEGPSPIGFPQPARGITRACLAGPCVRPGSPQPAGGITRVCLPNFQGGPTSLHVDINSGSEPPKHTRHYPSESPAQGCSCTMRSLAARPGRARLAACANPQPRPAESRPQPRESAPPQVASSEAGGPG